MKWTFIDTAKTIGAIGGFIILGLYHYSLWGVTIQGFTTGVLGPLALIVMSLGTLMFLVLSSEVFGLFHLVELFCMSNEES